MSGPNLYQADKAMPLPVFIDDLKGSQIRRLPGATLQSGRAATIDGTTYRHCLSADVERDGARSVASLTVRLDAAFATFAARAGRDDRTSADGPAYAYFEVWGDEQPLYKSPALRSRRYAVSLQEGAHKVRKGLEDVSLLVRGVRELRLTVRYAADVPQDLPPDRARAYGCIWADPALTPLSLAVPVAAVTNSSADPALRESLRRMIVQIGAQAASAAGADTPVRPLPLSVWVAPLVVDAPRLRQIPPEMSALREETMELLSNARRGDQTVFSVVREKGRKVSPTERKALSDETLREQARRAGAMLVLVSIATPGEGGESWNLEMRLLRTATGRREGAARAQTASRR